MRMDLTALTAPAEHIPDAYDSILGRTQNAFLAFGSVEDFFSVVFFASSAGKKYHRKERISCMCVSPIFLLLYLSSTRNRSGVCPQRGLRGRQAPENHLF